MALIETVKGAIAAEKLGRTLAHEHIVAVTDWVVRDYPDLAWGDRSATIRNIGERLRAAKAAGIDSIIDCTAMGHSRDVAAVAEANALADINIVMATGVYTYDALPLFFKFRPPRTTPDGQTHDILTEMFLRDIREGIQGTSIKAAVIKCATDRAGVTPTIDRILRATARAHRDGGAPIITHTDAASRVGLDQQRIFLEEGVDLRRVVIGHSGDTDDHDYLQRLLDAGSFIGADRFGLKMGNLPGLEKRCRIVADLVARGYEEQILLSHDSSVFTDWWPEGFGGEQPWRAAWNLELVPRTVVPMLAELGVGARSIERMLVDNPRRLLGANEPY